LHELKSCFAFPVNTFDVNVVGDGSPVHQPFVTNLTAEKLKLTDMQGNLVLKNSSQCHSTVDADNRFRKVYNQNLKDQCTTHFCT